MWNHKKNLDSDHTYLMKGLQLPNLKMYYWSAQLCSAMFYFSVEALPAWVSAEQSSVPNLLQPYLYSKTNKNLKRTTGNPFLKNTIDIWYKAHQHIKDISQQYSSTYFRAGRADGGFRIWADKGVQKTEDLYMNVSLLTFDQLCQTYYIPKKHFFKYLQLKHFI